MALPMTNLVARYIAGDWMLDSGAISQWNDSVGSYHLTQATAGSRPVPGTTGRGYDSAFFASGKLLNNAIIPINTRNLSVWAIGDFGFFNTIGVRGSEAPLTPIIGYNSSATVRRTIRSASTTAIELIVGETCYGAIYRDASVDVIAPGDSDTLAAAYSTTLNGLTVGGLGHICELLVYSDEQDSTAIDAVLDYASSTYGVLGTATNPYADYRIVCVGDSITAGATIADNVDFYPSQLARLVSGIVHNFGTTGYEIPNLEGFAASLDLTLAGRTFGRNILVVLIGRNDVGDAGYTDAATLYAAIASYISDRQAAGWEVWHCTCIATGVALQDRIDALNTLIRANSAGADKIIDLAARTELSDSTDLTYYSGDSTHPNATGAGVIAAEVAAALSPVGISPAFMHHHLQMMGAR